VRFFVVVLVALAAHVGAQEYRAELLPMPAAVDVRVVAAEGDLVVGLNSNQWFGAVWRREREFAIVPGRQLALFATDGFRVGGWNRLGLATIWELDPVREIVIHPPGYERWFGWVEDMQGDYQVGMLDDVGSSRAVVWRGKAETAQVLLPAGYLDSAAITIDGGNVYGTLRRRVGQDYQAYPCVWRDYGASVEVYGWFGAGEFVHRSRRGVQVGWRMDRRNQWQPFLWRGWPLGAVDLTPPGVYRGEALSTNGEVQVGYVIRRPPFPPVPTEGIAKAALWKGTRASYVDLHRLLPPFFDSSQATAVTADGTVYGTARTAPVFDPVPVIWRKVQ
jgi:hypothetical protein